MKAAVCYEFGKPLVVEEVDIDPPRKNEVRVRLAATAICHSDVHLVRGEWGNALGEPPIVAGHEAAGVIEEVGENVTLVKPRDAVVVSLIRSCGHCRYCSGGSTHLCETRSLLDQEGRLRNKRGEPIRQGDWTAAFAEHAVVDQSQVVQVPDDMPLDRAALLACGVITGFGAVINTAHVEPGSSVVVIGTGGVGLNAVQGARFAGAHPIIAVDITDTKLATAEAFGATHTINGERKDPVKVVQELTSGRGADYVFVAVGNTGAVAQGFNMIGRGGTLVIVGIPKIGATVPLQVDRFPRGERKVIGSSMGSTRLRVDVPWLVNLYRHGRLMLDELITARYSLEQINEAVDATEKGEGLRNVIMF